MRNLKYLVFLVALNLNPNFAVGTVFCGANQVCNGDINITETTFFENYGEINGNININCVGCAVQFKNAGTVSNNVNVIDGATPVLTQVITNNSDANRIGNLSGHVVYVQNDDNPMVINMAAVVDAAAGATSIELTNVSLIIEPGIPNYGTPINVHNNVSFIIVGANDDNNIPLLSNVVGSPSLQTSGIDPMFLPSLSLTNENLYLHLVRAIDYTSILDGEIGDFLNSVRANNANDKLIVALDNAKNRDELINVLNKSVRTNSIQLAHPMRTIINFDDLSAFANVANGIGARPLYIMSREFDVWGAAVSLCNNITEHLATDIAAFGAMMNYDGKYDGFSESIYGGRAGAVYSDDDVWVGLRGIYAFGATHDLTIFDGARAVQNPHAKIADVMIDVGPIFAIDKEIHITPFVGARLNWVGVLQSSETKALGRVGVETLFDTSVDGNQYNVGLRAVVHTDGVFYGAVRTGIESVADGINGALEFGAVNDDMGWSLQIGLSLKFLF